MQASRLTAIAGWLRSGMGAAWRGNRLATRFCRSAVCQNSDCGSCATSLGGWSASNSSSTMRRAVLARSVCVLTCMPEVGVRMQLAASTRSPSISTMQTRQLDAEAPRGAEDRLAGADVDLAPVDAESVGLADDVCLHSITEPFQSSPRKRGPIVPYTQASGIWVPARAGMTHESVATSITKSRAASPAPPENT